NLREDPGAQADHREAREPDVALHEDRPVPLPAGAVRKVAADDSRGAAAQAAQQPGAGRGPGLPDQQLLRAGTLSGSGPGRREDAEAGEAVPEQQPILLPDGPR